MFSTFVGLGRFINCQRPEITIRKLANTSLLGKDGRRKEDQKVIYRREPETGRSRSTSVLDQSRRSNQIRFIRSNGRTVHRRPQSRFKPFYH